jgi:hypothetical protein
MSGHRAAQRPASVHAATHAAPQRAARSCWALPALNLTPLAAAVLQERQIDFVGSTSSAEYSSALPCRCAPMCRRRAAAAAATACMHPASYTQQTKSDGDQSPH